VTLESDDIETIARRVVELLGAPTHGAVRYVDAQALATTLSVERDWVYANAQQLGAIRLGGPRGRLRFDLQEAQRNLARRSEPARQVPARKRRNARRRPVTRVDLLPFES
jgi:hypothetical protein